MTHREAYENLLCDIGEKANELEDTELTGFSFIQGEESDDGLMIIGRATNGWNNSWHAHELLDDYNKNNRVMTS